MLLIKISHDHPLKISRACAMTFHDEFPKFSWNHQFFFVCLWSGIASVLLFIPESWYFSHSLIVLWAKTIVMIICYLIFRTKTVLKSEKKTSLIHGCIINNNMLSLTLATQQNKSIGRGKQQQKISYKNKTKTLIFSHKKRAWFINRGPIRMVCVCLWVWTSFFCLLLISHENVFCWCEYANINNI